jgi:hypothetical protein
VNGDELRITCENSAMEYFNIILKYMLYVERLKKIS